jgi:hypothetical protein
LVVQPKISRVPTSAVDPGFYTTSRDVNAPKYLEVVAGRRSGGRQLHVLQIGGGA